MSTSVLAPYVEIYTDGGCDPNPGPGGWGAVLVSATHSRELSGAERETTNNRMELTAAIEALRALNRPCSVRLTTDSQYLQRGILEWLPKWVANGWRRANGQRVENDDLWRQLQGEAARHDVAWRWIRGHRGEALNERADALAAQARRKLTQSAGRRPVVPESASKLPHVEIYTRGCALGTPGPGGYAAVLLDADGRDTAVSGGWPVATNNAMELWAAIAALRTLRRPSEVTVHTVSKYLVDGATQWLAQWERQRWQTRSGEPVKHREIWLELSHLMGDHDIRWQHLPAGDNPHSQRAALLARQEADGVRSARL
jgi:ribonuclease HI